MRAYKFQYTCSGQEVDLVFMKIHNFQYLYNNQNSIRKIRKWKGITAKKLCDMADIPPHILRLIENGEHKFIKFQYFLNISKALDFPLDKLLSVN